MGAATFVSKRQKGYLWHVKRPVYLKFMAQRGGLDLNSLPWYRTRRLGLASAPDASAAGRWTARDRKIYDRVVDLYNRGFISQRKFKGAQVVFRGRARSRAQGKAPGRLSLELYRAPGRKKVARRKKSVIEKTWNKYVKKVNKFLKKKKKRGRRKR